ncbi:MAG: transglutaminase-like domain-containing protein, partial [candidate division WOR-3 bacterium]
GDCNEHAILYAALCRAIGIPCQICVGLVYVDNFFYYHAWNKVYLDKWISVDATFNQFPADATHIKFAEGELAEQATVLKIADKLKIRVIGFE